MCRSRSPFGVPIQWARSRDWTAGVSARCQTSTVGSNSQWGMTPQQSIERECARRGRTDVITGCRALVRGEQVDPDLLVALGGPAARKFLDGDVHDDTYWLQVWGARGLLWVWDDAA